MRNSNQPTILVIEDDPSFRETLLEVLREDGYRLMATGGAKEALGLLERELPSLILLDLMMPGINGQQLSRLLKANPRTAAVPVLALSGAGPEAVLEAEVDWYLAKPVEVQVLLSTVRHLIQRALPAAV
ncbi:MAG: response regulator [Myxococcota bacterium]|nr:response regulator [Myxococcota bacterium]